MRLNEANCVQAGGMSTCHWQWGASDGPGEKDKAQGSLFLGTCYGTLSLRKKHYFFHFFFHLLIIFISNVSAVYRLRHKNVMTYTTRSATC